MSSRDGWRHFWFGYLCNYYFVNLQAQSKNTGQLAAAKIVEINEEDELDDFSVEINILSICEHPHVIQLMEAYYYNSKLWVRKMTDTSYVNVCYISCVQMLVEFCAGGAIDNAILGVKALFLS